MLRLKLKKSEMESFMSKWYDIVAYIYVSYRSLSIYDIAIFSFVRNSFYEHVSAHRNAIKHSSYWWKKDRSRWMLVIYIIVRFLVDTWLEAREAGWVS